MHFKIISSSFSLISSGIHVKSNLNLCISFVKIDIFRISLPNAQDIPYSLDLFLGVLWFVTFVNETSSISNSLSVLQHTQAVVFVYMEHAFRTYNVSPHTVFILLVVLCEPVT